MLNYLQKSPLLLYLVSVLLISFGIGFSGFSESEYRSAQSHWLIYSKNASDVNQNVTDLLQHLGYGGFIHNFKNRVLRGPSARLDQAVERDIGNVRRLIEALNLQLDEPADRQSLSTIRRTMEEYFTNYQRLKMIPPGELQATEVDAMVRVDDRSAVASLMELQSGMKSRFEDARRVAMADLVEAERLMWLSRFALIASIVIAGIIVLAYQRLQVASLANARRSEEIIAAARIGTWEVNTDALDEGRLSDSARQIFGVPKGVPVSVSDSLAFFKEGNNRDKVVAALEDATEHGIPYDMDVEVVGYDKRHRWIRTVAMPQFEEGALVQFYGLIQDISDRKAIEFDYIKARDEAILANRAKSDFLSNMSHELRTPLNAIIGFSQLLLNKSLPETDKDNVKEIYEAGNHLLFLIEELLDLSVIESGKIRISTEPVELDAVLGESVTLIRTMADRRDIHIQLPDTGNLFVVADRGRLKQILLNLLSNAVKYNHRGGMIDVTVQDLGDRVKVSVADTGRGIEPDRVDEIFEAFNRLDMSDSDVPGTGIGLTLTRRLLKLMRGTIGVDSAPGGGSRFWIELPAVVDLNRSSHVSDVSRSA